MSIDLRTSNIYSSTGLITGLVFHEISENIFNIYNNELINRGYGVNLKQRKKLLNLGLATTGCLIMAKSFIKCRDSYPGVYPENTYINLSRYQYGLFSFGFTLCGSSIVSLFL